MVIGTGNFDDEAEIGFDHEFAGLGFAPANSATNFSLVGLVEERSFADALQVGLEGSGKFHVGIRKLGFSGRCGFCIHTRLDRRGGRTFGLIL